MFLWNIMITINNFIFEKHPVFFLIAMIIIGAIAQHWLLEKEHQERMAGKRY